MPDAAVRAGTEAPAADKPRPNPKIGLFAAISLFAGGGAALAAGYGEASLAAGLTAVFVVGAAVVVPGPVSYRAGLASGLIALAGLMLANVTTGVPVAAGLAMGVVSLLTGLSMAGGKAIGAIGMLLGTAYFLPAAINLTIGLDAGRTAELGLIGLGSGVVIVFIFAWIERLRGLRSTRRVEAERMKEARSSKGGVNPLALMWKSLAGGGPEARYGIRRGVILGLAMGVYQSGYNHNVFWVMLTMFAVLQPDAALTWTRAITRSAGTIGGALLIGALGQFLPPKVVVGLGVAALITGLSWYRSNYAIYVAGTTILTVSIFGAVDGGFATWAGLRVIDTIIGATIAIAAGYLILPDRRQPADA